MIKDYLAAKQKVIKPALLDLVKALDPPAIAFDYNLKEFLKNFLIGGKLYRGSLVFLGYDLFAATDSSRLDQEHSLFTSLLNIALAVELTHAAFLIHDDVMDQDHLRRNQKTFHTLMQEYAQEKNLANSGQVGMSLALCLGDLLLFMAQKQLAQIEVGSTLNKKICAHYAQHMQLTTWGQMEDVFLAGAQQEANQETIFNLYLLKTAQYTFVNPLLLGVMMAEADNKQQQLLINFARELGIIYQIKDDALNLFGRAEKIGKPVGSDIRENKKTIYRQLLFVQAEKSDQKLLTSLFSAHRELAEQDFKQIENLIKKYQIREKVEQLVKKHQFNMEKTLAELKIKTEAQQLLTELTALIIKRSK